MSCTRLDSATASSVRILADMGGRSSRPGSTSAGRSSPPFAASFSMGATANADCGSGPRKNWKSFATFSWLHTELVPYMYSHVVRCAKGGKPLQRPVEGKYHYLFGDDLLIAPIYQDSLQCEVHLPPGRWRYWFQDDRVVEGPAVLTRDFPLDEYPVYVRDGAIIPMHVSRDYTGIGAADWDAYADPEYLSLGGQPISPAPHRPVGHNADFSDAKPRANCHKVGRKGQTAYTANLPGAATFADSSRRDRAAPVR